MAAVAEETARTWWCERVPPTARVIHQCCQLFWARHLHLVLSLFVSCWTNVQSVRFTTKLTSCFVKLHLWLRPRCGRLDVFSHVRSERRLDTSATEHLPSLCDWVSDFRCPSLANFRRPLVSGGSALAHCWCLFSKGEDQASGEMTHVA